MLLKKQNNMQLEYCYYDMASNDIEIKDILTKVIKFPINTLSILPPHVKLIKSLIKNTQISISCPIDYPLGILDTKNRLELVEASIKNGAKIIDLVCPVYLLTNRKYDKFREDINAHKQLCDQYNIELRYILEYRLYSYELLYKVAQILVSYGIKVAYPSTGYFLDDINDNILACVLINKKNKDLNLICNGNIWNTNHINLIEKTNLFGIRVNSINALELIYQKVLKSMN